MLTHDGLTLLTYIHSYILMPCPLTGTKMFVSASPNFLRRPKNLIAFSASSKTFMLAHMLLKLLSIAKMKLSEVLPVCLSIM